MEFLVGPAFTIDVPSSPSQDGRARERIFLDGSPEDDGPNFRISGPPKFFTGGESESSSSIGTPDDESDNEEEEVQSKLKIRTGLVSLDALEDSLPIKLVPLISLSIAHYLFLVIIEMFFPLDPSYFGLVIVKNRSFHLFWVVD